MRMGVSCTDLSNTVILLAALKYENEVFGDNKIFQQDGTKPRRDHLSQEWCQNNPPSLVDNDRWSPRSTDLSRLDDSI